MRTVRVLRRSPLAVVALAYLAGLTIAVIAAPLFAPYDATAVDLDHVLATPTGEHLLGADMLGRDVLSRLMYGGRASLVGVLQAVATVLVLGVPLGLAAGFAGGLVDRAVSVITDIVLAIPVVVTLLVVLAVFGSNQMAAMVALGVLGTPTVARVVRSATLAATQEPWVAAARVTGLRPVTIVARHLLPRVAGPVVVQASIFAGVALIAETGLGYLGFGAAPPAPTWGGMVSEASFVIDRQPWMLAPSGVVIGLTVVAFGLVGDLVRDTIAARFRGAATGTAAAPSRMVAAPAPALAPGTVLSVRDLDITVNTEAGPSTVVDGAWLDVDPGEIVGLVGESGCGKTITSRAILGLLPRGASMTRGRILVGGQDMARPGAWTGRRGSEVAFVAQQSGAGLDPCYRVGEQIAELIGRSAVDRRARVRELLRDVNLDDDVARRYPHELSGGMVQRVAIALALAKRPRLLVADEPTTALDTTVQAEILDLLRRLRDENGMSILLITHDWGVVADLCDRAYVMYAGQVMETAATTVLMGRSRHPYTVGLLGSIVHDTAPRGRLAAIPGVVPDPRDWPVGCHFQPRCPLAIDACAAAQVPVAEAEPGHLTRCLRHEIVPARDQLGRTAAHAA
jgi:oligopeptide/dipeptide ABC transporter ATP-binding protein